MAICWTYFISVFLLLTQVLINEAVDECSLSQSACQANGGVKCDQLDACRNNGTTFCNETAAGWDCSCKAGYFSNGTVCYDVDECSFSTKTTCMAYNGKNCDALINCDKSNSIDKMCVNLVGSWQCSCSDGFEVDNRTSINILTPFTCIQIDECKRDLDDCGTYAKCIDRSPTFDDRSKYTCECPNGNFNRNSTGTLCDDINECKVNTVGTLCSRFSGCRNTIGSYVCACLPGYEQVGSLSNATVCVDVNECNSNICSSYNHTVCKNTNGSYECNCNSSYYNAGDVDKPNCLAIQPCSSTAFNNCTAPQICTPFNGSFKCNCPSGYTTKSDGSCLDRDECSVSISTLYPCERDNNIRKLMANNATCTNTLGSYRCDCPTGYKLTASNNCIGINYCTEGVNQCSSKSVCTYDGVPGQYRCLCKSNYLDGNELISSCVNRDECTLGQDNCDRANGYCNDTDGSFICGCNKGFEQDQNSIRPKCKDIDECFTGTACDTRYTDCLNTAGSFLCICKPGLEKVPNTLAHICRDINECCPKNHCFKSSNVEALCTNSYGSYDCDCPDGFFGNGYALNETFPVNGTGCTDIDECKYQPCRENQQCINTPGSFVCHCKPGFYLKSGFPLCLDINECRSGLICGPAKCVNTVGSYMCECPNSNYIGISINGVITCQEYFSLPSEQKLKANQLIAKILVLKKVFTVSIKVKFSPSTGNIIKLVDNEGKVYIDISLNDTKILNNVFGSTITISPTLNQWVTILITQYEYAGSSIVSVYQNNNIVGNATFDGPSEYGNLNLLTSNPAANASISDLKVSNGNTSIWSKWQLQSRCQPHCDNGTATYVRTCNSPICSFLNETKTESCKILNCNEGAEILKQGSCCGLRYFQNYEEFTTFFDAYNVIDVRIVLQNLKKFAAIQLPFVCNGTFNRLAWNDINTAYNQSAEGLNSLSNLKNTLRAYIGCHPNVLKRQVEPFSPLITAMFEKYEEIVERHFAVSNLFIVIKNKYREIKQKVDMCDKQGLVDILYDSIKAKSMLLEVSS